MAANVSIEINATDNASHVFGGLTVTLGDVMNIAGKVAGAVTDFFGSTIKAAEEQQDVSAQLEAGLKSTGGAAGVTMQQMQDLAEAQSKVTDFSKVQTEAIEKVALTFTSVNKDIFPQTISLSEDMAQRLGIQGTQAMTMIGKAMDDPIKGMGALHRVGVSFTDQQKDQIKALVAAGDTMGAQKILLGELSKEYGGSATAAGATFAGQQQILAHQFDEVKEKIGTALLPVLGQLTGIITANVLPVVQQFAEWFSAKLPDGIAIVQGAIAKVTTLLQPFSEAWSTASGTTANFAEDIGYALDTLTGWQDETAGPFQQAIQLVEQLFSDAGDSSTALGGVIADLQSDWQMLQPVIANVVNAVQSVVLAVFGVIQTFLQAHGADIKATMQDAWTRIQEIIKTGIELYNAIVPPVLRAIAGFIKDHGAEIQAILSATWDAVKTVIDVALTLIQGVIKIALDLIHGNWQQAWEDIKTMSARIVEDLIAIIKDDLEILKTVFSGAIKWIQDEWAALPGQLSNVGSAIVQAIRQGIEDEWSKLVSWFNDKLQQLKDKLPFSEPKDSSSPLYGLGKSGQSIVRNLQEGIGSAPQLRIGGPTVGGAQVVGGAVNGNVARSNTGVINSSGGQPVVVNINFANGMSWLKDFVQVEVNGVIQQSGTKALARQRTGN